MRHVGGLCCWVLCRRSTPCLWGDLGRVALGWGLGPPGSAVVKSREDDVMSKIKIVFWGSLAVLTGLWLWADSFVTDPLGFFPVRAVMVQYSGVLGICIMSVAMVLAARPAWLEPHLNGLDKFYRLHKWLGIAGLIMAIFHWAWAKGTKYAVGFGWLDRPQRAPRPPEDILGPIEQAFRSTRGTAEFVGEWAFYFAVILIVLALIKSFPYRLFAKTHWLLAPIYLVLVFHSVILMKFDYWTQPIGIVTGVLMLAGVVAAVMSLFGLIGRGRRTSGTVTGVEYFPALQVLETRIELDEGWKGHQGGQFAFVTIDPAEGAHPFTIASAWNKETRSITFISKALGDYTDRMPHHVEVGMKATVEGPYGRFNFGDGGRKQIWIGGGIGITPFIARMKQLAQAPHDLDIDLVHTTSTFDDEPFRRLASDASGAGVRLHVLVDARDGRLNGERLRALVPGWETASIWFCGPASFGEALRTDLVANGLSPAHFHQELFNMR